MSEERNSYYLLLPVFICVKGATRSALFDIHRNDMFIIPHSMHKIINHLNSSPHTRGMLLDRVDKDNWEYIDEYIEFLIEKEFLIVGSKSEYNVLDNINFTMESPYQLTNGIIDILDDTNHLKRSIEQMIDVECQQLQLRIFSHFIGLSKLSKYLDILEGSNVKSLQIVLPFDNAYKKDFISNFILDNPRVVSLIITSSPEKRKLSLRSRVVSFVKEDVKSHHFCGNVGLSYFAINKTAIGESQQYNSCLNRKISIDSDGNIKNCPSMRESYGNIKSTNLSEAIEKNGFKKYWDINKDKIHVCKDCEYRYVCTDCRAYVEDPEDILSKPLKCGYNPYTGEWNDWTKNPLKQKAIEHYGMSEMVEDD